MTDKPKYLTVAELIQLVPLKKTHVYTLIQNNKIPYIKLGGKYVFDHDDIINWLNNAKVSAKK